MKKIYSFALAAVAILSAASCQKELVNDNFDAAGEKFTVTAVASADSKTVLDGVNTYWTPGDIIAVYDATGAEVTFSTAITEQAATAKFTADAEFVAPESLVAVYPKRTDRGATTFADGVIKDLHVGGGQTAVAGSFEPKFAVSVGTPKAAGSTELVFTAAHSLVKFTVGGEAAPTTVTLKNNGMRAIAGMFDYNTADGAITMTAGNPYIDVTGNFEVGKTYYIVMTSGVCGNGISLLYDGVEMKNTGETFTAEPNKIYNLGTLPAPAEEPEYSEWGLVGTMNSWGGTPDIQMVISDEYVVAKNVSLTTADEFKFRTNNSWGTELTSSELVQPDKAILVAAGNGNMKVAEDGVYDVYLDVAKATAYFMTDGKTPADAVQATTVDVEIYCAVSSEWDNTHLYAWGAISASWPGYSYTEKVEIDGVEFYKWVLTVDSSVIGGSYQIIFNNNAGTQTADSEAYILAEKQYFQIIDGVIVPLTVGGGSNNN